MANTNLEVPEDLLAQVRTLLPKSPMPYGQARIKAQQLALHLRRLLGTTDTRLPLDFVERLPGVTVTMLTAPKMERLTHSPSTSGATAIRKGGVYHVYINENNTISHCRFTLAHELFHVITGEAESAIFGDFGNGDSELRRRRIESVADHFAANLLMPSTLLKREWRLGIQTVRELAADFSVSEEAMRIRLRTVGLVRSTTKRMFYRLPRRNLHQFLRQTAAQGTSPRFRGESAYREVHECPGAVLTVGEACERLRISRWTLYQLINKRQLTTIKLGARRLVPESALGELISQLSAEETA